MNSEQKEQAASSPSLCANKCGFYGNAANENLCSKCFREYLQKTNQQKTNTIMSINSMNNNNIDLNNNNNSSSFSSSSPSTSTFSCENNNNSENFFSVSSSFSSSCTSIAIRSNNSSNEKLLKEELNSSDDAKDDSCDVTTHEKISVTDTSNACSTSIDNNNISSASVSPSSMENVVIKNKEETREENVQLKSQQKDEITVKSRAIQEKVNRCWKCNKKIGLLGFLCRCGYTYCDVHRHSDLHNCDFDFKTYERELLKKQNNKVVASKIDKI